MKTDTLILIAFLVQASTLFAQNQENKQHYPVPYQHVQSRPKNDPYCQAGLAAFCPTGKTVDPMPHINDTDTVEVFALKKPVWSFKYGPLLGYFKIMHDALGFRNKRTGLNYTMEWYELDQLFNCTFPHLQEQKTIKWCNQGALCVYEGINDTIWTKYGTLAKVSEVSGSTFSRFANWTQTDNATAVYYETFTVVNNDDYANTTQSLVMYFDSFDCASWVLRAFDQLYAQGAKFDLSVQLNYTRLNLIAFEPMLLGNISYITNYGNQTLIADMLDFFSIFQRTSDLLDQVIRAAYEIRIRQEFYFYYNEMYWYLKLKAPFIGFSYVNIPLPGF
jgi:ceroid-lipofuscinosis neuronal protein 5